MIKKLALIQILLIFSGGCTSFQNKSSELKTTLDSLSDEDFSTLETFFRILLSKSQGGYVLYGNKPLCLEAFAYREEGSLFLTQWIHAFSTELKRGALLWEKLGLDKYCQTYRLHISKNTTDQWQDLLFINKKQLLFCVRTNLSLFKYVLGPSITPTHVLEQLLDPYKTFGSVIHKDSVLTGILLGYGTQNALYCSRSENIQDNPDIQPTYGFKTLQDETRWLEAKSFLSVKHSEKTIPLLPWFGCYDLSESEQLIASYKKTQKQIAKILRSPNFLEKVLSVILEQKVSLKAYRFIYPPSLPERRELIKIVSQGIWHCISEKSPEYVSLFIQGLQASEEGSIPLPEEEFCNLRVRYREASELREKDRDTYDKVRNEIAYYAGLRVWNHFKLGKDLYSLSDILPLLKELQTESKVDSIDSQSDKVLTDLHWFLYQERLKNCPTLDKSELSEVISPP